MKRFVIVAPRPGRTTVSLVAYKYVEETKRTKTVYAGSFPSSLDPVLLEAAPLLAPGQNWHGLRLSEKSPISLAPAEITVIRNWLEAHGSVAAMARLNKEVAAKAANERVELRALLASEARVELLASIKMRDLIALRMKALAAKVVQTWQYPLRKKAPVRQKTGRSEA